MSTNPKGQEDQEIDLTEISRKMGNVFSNFNSFLFRSIRFFLKNSLIILILLVVGVGLGVYLDKTQKKYNHEIIVAANFGSVDYLYGKLQELDSKIKENDTVFLKSIGVNDPDKLVKIKIEPLSDVYGFINRNELNIEILRLMAEDGDMKKIIEDEATSKNYPLHKISFITKHTTTRKKSIDPILNYLNSSEYYSKVRKEYVENVDIKIKTNNQTIAQIDGVLNAFSSTANGTGKSSSLVYYNENTQLNDVIETKDKLVREQGSLRIEKVGVDKIIKDTAVTMNIENDETANGKMKLILPLLFIFLFVGFRMFVAFYKKQSLKAVQA